MPSIAPPIDATTATRPPDDANDPNRATQSAYTKPDASPTRGHSTTLFPLPVIPGHTIVRHIGIGGMGEVYEALNALGVRVALKVVRRDRVSTYSLTRFQSEARALMQLNHPHVVRIFGYGEAEEGAYFTMQFFPGGTLAERFGDYANAVEKAVLLMVTIAEAVQYIHDHGMIHRDLKPQNILLTETSQPVVSDFGIVKNLPLEQLAGAQVETGPHLGDAGFQHIVQHSTLTRDGGAVGTIAYMSPEQVVGDKERIGVHTDVWALGVMLFQLLTNRKPFEKPTPTELMQSIQDDPPVGLRYYRPDLDPELESIVMGCLIKECEQRTVSAGHLAGQLRGWLENASRPPVPVPPAPSRRKAIAAMVSGIALATTAGYYALREKPKVTPPPTDTLAELLQELETNGRVEILDQEGKPRWSEWIVGASEIVTEDKTLSFNNPAKSAVSMLELIRNLPQTSYRIHAEIEQTCLESGLVGIYFGRSAFSTPQGLCNCFGSITWNDRLQPQTPQTTAGMCLRACMGSNPLGFFHTKILTSLPPLPKRANRRVVMDFFPKGVAVSIDGTTSIAVTTHEIQAGGRDIALGRKGFQVVPLFGPHEGIGLLVRDASIKVRRFSIVNTIQFAV